ncbi:MAG TPA: hypothetical protein VGF55_05615 [Gemmataceae bacterium]|jgi:hypothetical protein
MNWVKAFAIAAGQNTKGADATGSFLLGARRFHKAFRCPFPSFDNNAGKPETVRQRFFDTIDTYCPGGTNLFAYFGHGIREGLLSAHVFEQKKHLDGLLEVLRPKVSSPLFVALYCCSAGATQAFSGKLRARLGPDVWVYGHTSAKHAFDNPDVSEEATANSPTFRLLHPVGSEFAEEWAVALRYTDLWLRFPVIDDDAIVNELNARRLLGTWEVTGGGAARRYEFTNKFTAWTATSGRDLDAASTGTVKAVDPKKHGAVVDEGTWEVSNVVAVTWKSGAKERWVPPLQVVGQPVLTAANQLTARRLTPLSTHGVDQADHD